MKSIVDVSPPMASKAAVCVQGLRWSSFPVDSHQFPKLRLKFKQNLISLAGGMTRLPVTDAKVRLEYLPLQCAVYLLTQLMHALAESVHVPCKLLFVSRLMSTSMCRHHDVLHAISNFGLQA